MTRRRRPKSRPSVEPNPSGLCMCGCGAKTQLAKESNSRDGVIAGKPRRYVKGHACRGPNWQPRPARYPPPKPGLLYLIDPETGCWEWQLRLARSGYGRVTRGGRSLMAHRWMYEQEVGPIPEGLALDHLCRNRGCVNPAHLEPVTGAVNQQRGKLAKLVVADVIAIRNSDESVAVLALRFGVRRATIYGIRSRRSWKNVA